MSLGVIVATNQELTETKRIMNNIVEIQYYNLNFCIGKISNCDIVLVKCGVGKVNAARTTQILIDKFDIEKIINIGAAGGVNPKLNVKDIVIGKKLVQYDFNTSELGDTTKGEIDGVGKYFESDSSLVEKCKQVLNNEQNKEYEYKVGVIATADCFCSDLKISEQIRKEFDAECVDMEGAAIAQVCYLDNIPFLVVRGISDTPNKTRKIDYFSYCNIAAKQAAGLIKKILIEK